jgi:hypothetical protein
MAIPTRRLAAPAIAGLSLIAIAAFPSTRASAQAFLDLFRVVNVAAVPVNVDRLKQLSQRGLDIETLIGSQVEVLANPGPAQAFTSPAEAAAAAGLTLRAPTVLPPGLVLVRTELKGERAASVTADTSKLRDVLDALEITDLSAPAGFDGQTATIRVPPVVRTVYANGAQEVSFFQARSPEMTLPPGIDVPPLAEIGLRIAGLGSSEAHMLANAIDWRSTLLVPIPAASSTFRQVDLPGGRGLFVEPTTRRGPRAILWANGGMMYAMTGAVNSQTLLQMARSVQ